MRGRPCTLRIVNKGEGCVRISLSNWANVYGYVYGLLRCEAMKFHLICASPCNLHSATEVMKQNVAVLNIADLSASAECPLINCCCLFTSGGYQRRAFIHFYYDIKCLESYFLFKREVKTGLRAVGFTVPENYNSVLHIFLQRIYIVTYFFVTKKLLLSCLLLILTTVLT